jgi:hypothetical protein
MRVFKKVHWSLSIGHRSHSSHRNEKGVERLAIFEEARALLGK